MLRPARRTGRPGRVFVWDCDERAIF